MRKKEYVAMLLAGGQGCRLGGSTQKVDKLKVSFCGKYEILRQNDFRAMLVGIDPQMLTSNSMSLYYDGV